MCLKKVNVNPAKRITEDSYVRSITLALKISYKQAYRALSNYALGQCLAMNDCRAFKSFLKSMGYYEQRLQRSCSVETFVDNYAESNKTYILKIGKNNATVVKDKVVFENFDVSKKSVSAIWKIN